MEFYGPVVSLVDHSSSRRIEPILEAAASDRENDLVMKRRLIVGQAIDANVATQFHRIIQRESINRWAN